MSTAARMLSATCFLSACLRGDSPSASHVAEPLILAVLADPAEATPGQQVHYRALLVDEDGPRDQVRARWSFCETPRALRENTSVSAACAENEEQPLSARSPELDAAIPRDACARFGSETALGQRPLDPDHTGGYYQPLRLSVDGLAATIVRQRITCPLASAPIDVARRFDQRYTANKAPEVAALRFYRDGAQVQPDALPARASVTLELALVDGAREDYPLYDPVHGLLVTARETLSIRWYVTRGELANGADTIGELRAENVLATPAAGSAFWLWAVVRDDRGGVSVSEQPLYVPED